MYLVHIDNSRISWIRFAFSAASFFCAALGIAFEKYSSSYMKSIRFAKNGEQLAPIGMPITCFIVRSPACTYRLSSK